MSTDRDKTMVVIFGTFHSGKEDTPEYAERLRLILKEIGPDVICAELSPEQLSGEASCKSKPEYPDVILPFAKEHATPVVPIQPDAEAGLKLEQEMARIVRESTAGAAGNACMRTGVLSDSGMNAAAGLLKWLGWSPFRDECTACDVLPLCMGGCPFKTIYQSEVNDADMNTCSWWAHNLKSMLLVFKEAKERGLLAPHGHSTQAGVRSIESVAAQSD